MKLIMFIVVFLTQVFTQGFSQSKLLLFGDEFSPLSLNPFAYYLDNVTKDAKNKVTALASETDTYTFVQADTSKSPTANNNEIIFIVDDEMSISDANAGSFDFGTNDFSIEFWIKSTSAAPIEGIIYKYGSVQPRWRIYYNNGAIVFYFRTAAGIGTMTSSGNVKGGEWHHVIISLDRDSGADIYIDKNKESETGSEWTNLSGSDMNNADAVYLGSANGAGYFNGSLSNIRVYLSTLSQIDVNNLFSYGRK